MSGERRSGLKRAGQDRPRRYARCIKGDGVDLTTGRLYRILPDHCAEDDGLLRVIDDSGEDYLCAASRFEFE